MAGADQPGGLIRSMGGWAAVKALRRDATYMKGDELILGDGDFVNVSKGASNAELTCRKGGLKVIENIGRFSMKNWLRQPKPLSPSGQVE